jgi:hypothetical protein
MPYRPVGENGRDRSHPDERSILAAHLHLEPLQAAAAQATQATLSVAVTKWRVL